MLKLLLKKWWVILLQGILLIVLAIYAFNNPITMLVGLSFWIGLIVLGAGLAGIFGYFGAEKAEKENMSLWWAILTTLLGLMMLMNMVATMKAVTILFGIWMIATGAMLAQWGWNLKKEHNFGWLMLITGVLSVIAGIMMLFNFQVGAEGISTLLGLQALLAGIGFILFSFVKRAVGNKVEDKIETLKSKLQ